MLTDFQYLLLIELKRTNSINRITAKTINELMKLLNLEFEQKSKDKIRIIFRELMKQNYVEYGLPDGKSKSFYITASGIKEVNSISDAAIDSIFDKLKNGGFLKNAV